MSNHPGEFPYLVLPWQESDLINSLPLAQRHKHFIAALATFGNVWMNLAKELSEIIYALWEDMDDKY